MHNAAYFVYRIYALRIFYCFKIYAYKKYTCMSCIIRSYFVCLYKKYMRIVGSHFFCLNIYAITASHVYMYMCKFCFIAVLPIIVSLLLKGRADAAEMKNDEFKKENIELTMIFLSDLVLLLNTNQDNKRYISMSHYSPFG